MSSRFRGLLTRAFFNLLATLAAVALSIFVIFNFLPFWQLSEYMGLVWFIIVTCLLIAGYMLGITTLAFVGLYVLTELWKQS